MVRRKINDPVTFPNELDMAKFTSSPTGPHQNFKLVAVCNHVGKMAWGGHCTADVRNRANGKWYTFDDTTVHEKEKGEPAVNFKTAYVLFYLREDLAPSTFEAQTEVRKRVQQK